MQTNNKIIYKIKLPKINEYVTLFNSTGWNEIYKISKNNLKKSLKNSYYFISAYSHKKLVGFGRLLSDGYLYSIICDMIVLPEFQKQGIGTKILDKIINKCKE